MIDEELKSYLDREFAGFRAALRADLEKTETKLLSVFHGWGRSMEIRQRGASSSVAGFDERLTLAEERISELERSRSK